MLRPEGFSLAGKGVKNWSVLHWGQNTTRCPSPLGSTGAVSTKVCVSPEPQGSFSAGPSQKGWICCALCAFRMSLETTNEAAHNVTYKTVSCLPGAVGDSLTASGLGLECAQLRNKTASLS